MYSHVFNRLSSCIATTSRNTHVIRRKLSLLFKRRIMSIMLHQKSNSPRQCSYSNICSTTANDDYKKAISALNTLQSNKRSQNDSRMVQHPTHNMSTMLDFLNKCDIDVQALEQKLSVIHVSGTKGKGSTCAYCESILRQYGYRTGFFSSPHLCSVRERIRINGEPLSKRKFANYFRRLYEKLEQKKGADLSMPPYFMFLTMMALEVFLEERVDVAIMEVGIGGEYDCTNILKKTAVVGISSLGYDHVRILGNSIEEIAWQKAGIMKPSSVIVTAANQPEAAMRVLRNRAVEKGCTLYVAPDLSEYESEEKIVLGVSGPVQRLNASLALQLTNAWMNPQHYLQEKIEVQKAPVFSLSQKMLKGLRMCSWLGRTQVVQHSAQLSYYLDGAHTDESIQYCLEWFEQMVAPSSGTKKVLVFNMIGDRDTKTLLKLFLPHAFDLVCFCTNRIESSIGETDKSGDNWAHPSNEEEKRAVQNHSLWMELNPGANVNNTRLIMNVDEVHELMQKLAQNEPMRVLVTGSLHLVGALLSVLTSEDEEELKMRS